MTWLIAMAMLAGWRNVFRRPNMKPEDAARIVKIGPSTPEAMGNALMFLSMAYRPNHAFVAKAQIVEREDQTKTTRAGRIRRASSSCGSCGGSGAAKPWRGWFGGWSD